MLTEFHFLRPVWLLLIPLSICWALWSSKRRRHAGWSRLIPQSKLLIPLIISAVALAGPAWQLLPANVATSTDVRIFLLDLSPSMLARDIAPDRLTKARLKLIDMLRLRQGSESALIVYAGDAHQVTPLTDDPATIEALVPTLHPDIMPIPGNRPELAISMAIELVENAQYDHGDLVLITDGVPADAIATIKSTLPPSMRLSILGVGTTQGAPVPTQSGYLTDEAQNIIMASLNTQQLERLAGHFDGRYRVAGDTLTDVEYLNDLPKRLSSRRSTERSQNFDQHDDAGYWLVLLLLPLAIIGFRKNLLWIGLPLLITPPQSYAMDWESLWLNSDQRAARRLAEGDAVRAAELFSNGRWRSIAHYRAGNYLQSVELMADAEYAEDFYNLGNAQALAGDLFAALKSYELALLLYQPDAADRIADTVHNIAVVKSHLEKESDDQNRPGEPNEDANATDEDGTDTVDVDTADVNESSAGSARQSAVGGTAGGPDSLDQTAMSDQGSAGTRPGESDDLNPESPADANSAQASTSAPADTDLTTERDRPSTMTPIETQSGNRVLTPYSEQWLRELPLDPGGYLRRKFFYESKTAESATDEQWDTRPVRLLDGRY